MKIVNILAFLMIFLFVSCSSEGQSTDEVSGSVENGLRILSVGSGNRDLNFTVYRGDYIVFDFADGGTYDFNIPELGINESMPRPQSEKPYVKMKQSGQYGFSLGNRRGMIEVLDFREANYSELTAEEAFELLANTDPIIIDVRTQGEYNSVHIEGAGLLPVQIIADNLDKLEKFKGEDLLLYCASGNRSTVASKILLDAGFTNIYNLRYGIGDWIQKGYPVVQGQ